ncbi:MAG: MATE family efflux transporter [Myxococcota bacterium]
MTTPFENPTRKRALSEETARLADQAHIESKGSGPFRPGGLREVSLLAYPVVLTQLSVTLMGVVDIAMVGRIGPVELAAVGFGGTWIWTLFCFFIGMSGVVQTFVSQYHGARQPELCGAWCWQGTWLVMPMTAVMGGALLLGLGPLLNLVLPSEEMRPLTETYMSIRVLGAVGMVGGYVFASFFRGIGNTRTPLYATLLANGINLVLDYGLIFGRLGLPEWGVAGAAVATAVAEWVFAFVMLALFLRPRLRRLYRTAPVRIDWAAQKRVMRTGFPIGGQWATEMLFFSVFLTMVAHLGNNQMAASQVFISLLSLSFMQAAGVGIAVATLVGRYIGAEQPDYVKASYSSGQKLALIISLFIAALFLFFPQALMRIFTDNPEVIEMGRRLLLLGAFYQIFDAVCIVADNALRGAGDTRIPFIVRFVLACVVLMPLAWYFGFHLEGGVTGMWIASGVDLIVLAAFLIWRFHSGAWQKIKI